MNRSLVSFLTVSDASRWLARKVRVTWNAVMWTALTVGLGSAALGSDALSGLSAALRCRQDVLHQLSTWGALEDSQPVAAHPWEDTRLVFPTKRIGVWLELRQTRAHNVSLARIDAKRTTRIDWGPTCEPSRSEVDTRLGASDEWLESRPDSDLMTDQDIERLVADEPRVLFYLWSPHMPLSVDGVREAVQVAERLEFRAVPLVDWRAELGYVASVARDVGLPPEALRAVRSVEFIFRNVMLHAPTAIAFVGGRALGPAIPGYHDADGYERVLRRQLRRFDSDVLRGKQR